MYSLEQREPEPRPPVFPAGPRMTHSYEPPRRNWALSPASLGCWKEEPRDLWKRVACTWHGTGEEGEKLGPLCIAGVQPLWKMGGRIPKKLNVELPYGPAIPLLDPKELKAGSRTES